jgi:hypothetical protein
MMIECKSITTCFGYVSYLQAVIYNHLFDLDIECFRAMGSHMALHCNIQYLSQISDCK